MWEPPQAPAGGYVVAYGTCAGCRKLISFNPLYVPSVRVGGVAHPVCRTCIEVANPKRVAAGLEPFVIHPQAFEPLPEHDLPLE